MKMPEITSPAGTCIRVVLLSGLLLRASLAAGQTPASQSPLTPEVRTQLTEAARVSRLEPWQQKFMLDLAARPESTAVAPPAPIPGLALPLSGSDAWNLLAPPGSSPSARYYNSAIYDAKRARMVVFGGIDSRSSHNDVWALSLSGNPEWSALAPTGNAPSARYGHSAIYDPARDRMVVFGGYAAAGSCQDLWALSLGESPAWSALEPDGKAPAARHGHSAVYDSKHERMVVFGGYDGYGARRDARALSLAGNPAWSAISPKGELPSARYGHTASYDADADRMVVSGGQDAIGAVSVWALSLSGSPVWTDQSHRDQSDTTGPAGRSRSVHHFWPTAVRLEGGLGVPGGSFSDKDKFNAASGVHLGGSFDYRVANRIALGADASYLGNQRSDVDLPGFVASLTDEYTTIQVGLHARIFLLKDTSPVSLWGLLGAGGYSLKEKWTVTYNNGAPPSSDEGKDKTGMRPGAKAGLGVDFKAMKRLSVGLAADFNYVLLDKDKTNENFEFVTYDDKSLSLQFIRVHAGITFHPGSK